MKASTKRYLIVGGLAAVAGAGIYFYVKKSAQLAQMPLPPTLPAGPSPIQLTLSPGQMSAIPLSLSAKGTLSIFAPTGATLGVMNWTPTAVLAPAATATYEVVAASVGTATITATYKDAAGNAQTSIIPVTVTA
jgi:hypothetical protein